MDYHQIDFIANKELNDEKYGLLIENKLTIYLSVIIISQTNI